MVLLLAPVDLSLYSRHSIVKGPKKENGERLDPLNASDPQFKHQIRPRRRRVSDPTHSAGKTVRQCQLSFSGDSQACYSLMLYPDYLPLAAEELKGVVGFPRWSVPHSNLQASSSRARLCTPPPSLPDSAMNESPMNGSSMETLMVASVSRSMVAPLQRSDGSGSSYEQGCHFHSLHSSTEFPLQHGFWSLANVNLVVSQS